MGNGSPAEPEHAGIDARRAHPTLDPLVIERYPEFYRSVYRLYLAIRDTDRAYGDFINRLLNPPGAPRTFDANLLTAAYYLNEAQRYIDSLLELFPRRQRIWLRPGRKVAEMRDLRELLGVLFNSGDRREVFEAHRLIYLARLFLSVAATWQVQRGELHRDFFADFLEREFFCHTVSVRDVDIAFGIGSDGMQITYHDGPARRGEEAWRFHLRELNFIQDGWPVRLHVYFYSCRSKREVLPYRYVRGREVYELRARERWSSLARPRDAAIVSKMLRKGATSPREIPDIVGAMFIARDLCEVEILKEALFDILGGPMKIRNVVDTLTRGADRRLLNRFSGAGYEVFKGELDLLYPAEWAGGEPYAFTVELQIYTLETYLRTIHAKHYASHHRLKRRQFLEGIAPLLFPDEIYGAGRRASRRR